MGMQHTLPMQSWTDLQSKKHDAVLTVNSTLDCCNCYHMNWPCYCQCSNLRCWDLGMLTHCLLAFYAFTSQYDSNCSTHTKKLFSIWIKVCVDCSFLLIILNSMPAPFNLIASTTPIPFTIRMNFMWRLCVIMYNRATSTSSTAQNHHWKLRDLAF